MRICLWPHSSNCLCAFEKTKLILAFVKPCYQARQPRYCFARRGCWVQYMRNQPDDLESSTLFLTLAPVFSMAFRKPFSQFVPQALAWHLRLIIVFLLYAALQGLQMTNALQKCSFVGGILSYLEILAFMSQLSC